MIGIIAEGPSDAEVVKSVLIGTLGIEGSKIRTLMPSQSYDESHLSRYSTWTLVIDECKQKKLIGDFIDVLGGVAVVIHLDTDTVEEKNYCGSRPPKDKEKLDEYCIALRNQVVNQMDTWLGEPYIAKAAHAIAIEEIEAWLIPLVDKHFKKDTSSRQNAKERFKRLISDRFSERERKVHFQLSPGERFKALSNPLRKKRELDETRKKSKSLDLFCEELESKKSNGQLP